MGENYLRDFLKFAAGYVCGGVVAVFVCYNSESSSPPKPKVNEQHIHIYIHHERGE